MKKRKTVSINRIISDNDDAERQRRCRREGAKSGKVQKPLYLTVEQLEMLLELRKSITGNQQDVINQTIKLACLHYSGNLLEMPKWFDWKIKLMIWIKSFPLLKQKCIVINSTGKKVRKTFDMNLDQQRYLSKLMKLMGSSNQQATIIKSMEISLDYYLGQLTYYPKTFSYWQKFLIWIKKGVFLIRTE